MEIIREGQDDRRPPFTVHVRPVCVCCNCEMRCEKNGAFVHLVNSDAYLSGDTYECPACGIQIVSGLAREATHFINPPSPVVASIES